MNLNLIFRYLKNEGWKIGTLYCIHNDNLKVGNCNSGSEKIVAYEVQIELNTRRNTISIISWKLGGKLHEEWISSMEEQYEHNWQTDEALQNENALPF